ncbi:hypothetical protein GA398_05640 [Bacteroides xylanisolvens]|uniref:DGQHR domain-containing protein n=1 Tax=Bacteroides xylanisolvens TaxID=371601 RepID=A0A7J5PZZ9_9BACE|nr:hypothetical protein [Bacteroides xylanisolvens]KAB6148991.1 hypothetical protein GA398_05640 [Bacteroides xylanisolvens]
MAKKNTKKTKKRLSSAEISQRNEQRNQKKEICDILKNIGFEKLSYIDGKEFNYEGRTSELDDIFIFENVILLTEYTIGDPHLLKKSIFYDRVNSDKKAFINFMLQEEKLSSFKKYYQDNIKDKYSINQLRVKILYCSKKSISEEHKSVVNDVIYFDYHIVQYFKSLTKVIKRSSKYEFLEFIGIPFNEFGENILGSGHISINKFSGHILPEEKSSFKEGYKIVSFYIDAESLIKRAYVLRQEGWREKENIGYYQRMFEAKKISNMRKYLTENSRVFINNIISTIAENQIKLFDRKGNPIIINDKGEFEGDNASTNVTPALIEINDECNIIGLIDGQHRTYAYHEGDDIYEPHIAKLRKIQNLLVTGILFPQKESKESRLKFEANLFLEINLNQIKVKPKLQQEIELMITPFSNIAIGKRILKGLNSNGPLSNLIEQYSFEKGKIKTASIVSFGLKPLIKLDDIKSKDSLYSLWENQNKARLKERKSEEYQILNEYISFCITKIRDLLIAFKSELSSDKWETYTPQNPNGMLNVTFINGVLNVLRLLIENNKISDIQNYKEKLKDIDKFDFKKYKSSQYRKMGKDIYARYFENAI